jgi:hypothetical protein
MDSFEIPNSATPTVDANGEVAIDTTVTDFSHGVMKYYGGEEMAVIAVPIAELTTPTDGYIIAYNATNDEFELAAPGGGITNGAGNNVMTKSDGTNLVASSFSNASADIMTGSGSTALQLSSGSGAGLTFDVSNYVLIGGGLVRLGNGARGLDYFNNGGRWMFKPQTNGDQIDLGTAAAPFHRTFTKEYISMEEMTAPSSAPANSAYLFLEDNGAGKTRLMAIFQSGAAQQLAIEP